LVADPAVFAVKDMVEPDAVAAAQLPAFTAVAILEASVTVVSLWPNVTLYVVPLMVAEQVPES
jgi:hypothetical protein